MAELLRLDKITAGYGDSVVLDDVSLSMEEGGSLALLGRNGVGKTTLLVTLMGLTRVRTGKLDWRGREIVSVPSYKRARAWVGFRKSVTCSRR
jgi:branched-chain amino acid transport system ATP-binding protein